MGKFLVRQSNIRRSNDSKPVLTRKKSGPNKSGKKKTKKLFKALFPEEAVRLIKSIQNPRDKHGLFFCLNTGLRVGELTGLVWNDVWDFFRNCPVEVLRVRGEIAKRGKERFVPLNLKAAISLAELMKFYGKVSPEDALLISRKKGKGLTPRQVERVIKDAAREAGITRISVTPHVLRHSFATNVLKSGGDVMTLKELMGHSDISTTMIYLHVDGEQKRKAVEGI